MKLSYFLLVCIVSVTAGSAPGADAAGEFQQSIEPFFQRYCLRCHGADKQQGDFRLDNLSRDLEDMSVAQRWGEVMFRINSGEMPPEDQPQPAAGELGRVAEWISSQIKQGQAARMARRGPVAHYRLSREEYGHTVFDLVGVHFDVEMPGALNEDPRWHGFNRIGSMLSLSPSHVNRYFAAAETVLHQAYPEKQPAVGQGRSEAKDGRWLLFPSRHVSALRAREPGLYKLRIGLSALPSFKGRMPRLSIWNNSLKQSVVGRDVAAPEQSPTNVEIEIYLPAGNFSLANEAPGDFSFSHTLSHTPKTITSTKDLGWLRPTGYKLFDERGNPIFPLLLVDWIEWEGPLLPQADRKKREPFYPAQSEDLAAARSCLERFATRAWRRPATAEQVDRYMNVVETELAAGESFRSAYLAAMTGVLTSKNFYYIVEGSAGERRRQINDWELATRLAYFLFSSMPDDELFAAARAGKLTDRKVLQAQLRRMLADPKIRRFTDSFPQQWLQLHKVGMFQPDPELYPDYDKWLEQSMILESSHFFDTVFSQNLSLREFLVSDWTKVNSRLALHYGMPQPQEPGFQRVELRPHDHRGGLLTQASVLSLTSDGTRHRPVHRGVLVSEAIFGRTPPPPPPNVEPLEPTPSNEPKATVRMQLEAHATHATCASCHAKIDPLGFAFDNYDAIGRWREREEVPAGEGEDPLVDASGALPDGGAYSGPGEFKQLLADDLDRFAEAFVEQLATYALRRVMTIDDAEQIKAIAAASKEDAYRLQAVIENLVLSDLFQRR